MTQKEWSQLQMLRFFRNEFYKHNKEFCDGIPAVKIILRQLFLKIDKIEKIQIKGGRGRAFRDLKICLCENVCDSAFRVTTGLLAFANLTKNKVLRNAVNYCYSDFFRSVEQEMLNRCKQILRTSHRTKGLSFVGFDENLLVELHDNIQKYEKLMLEKDESKMETMKFNFLISKLFNECMQILTGKLTPLMKMLSKKHPVIGIDYLTPSRLKNKPVAKRKETKICNQKSKHLSQIFFSKKLLKKSCTALENWQWQNSF
ncbi:MAG: hypothetical protein ABIT08_16435 [Bacteroidia bacterium]